MNKAQRERRRPGSGLEWAISPQDLEPGDVIVSTGCGFESWLIREATGSRASHVALHIGGGFIVEAGDHGVCRRHVRALRHAGWLRVLRPTKAAPEQLRQISSNARALVYRPYSTAAAIRSVLPLIRQSKTEGRFCSQLVAEAFACAEVVVLSGTEPHKTLPRHFDQSPHFSDVSENVLKPVSTAAMERAVHALKPTMFTYTSGQVVRPKLPADVEKELLALAAEAMRKSKCFRKPFHYFDVLRQLRECLSADPAAVRLVDEKLTIAVRESGALSGEVRFRPPLPGLIGDHMTFQHFPFVDAGETREDLEVFGDLCADLRFSEHWDREDWTETLEEMDKAAHETGLRVLAVTCSWLLRDYTVADSNYKQLRQVPSRSDLSRSHFEFE